MYSFIRIILFFT